MFVCQQTYLSLLRYFQVGSRRVILMAGFLMLIFGCVAKFSALVVTMPDPIVGASFILIFGN